MDAQAWWNVLGGGAMAALGWFCKTIYGAVRKLESDLNDHKVKVAEDYAPKSALQRIEEKIDAGFDRIYSKLDAKADKGRT